jgi:hypothetical protein
MGVQSYTSGMNSVKEIEAAIENLRPDEFTQVVQCFARVASLELTNFRDLPGNADIPATPAFPSRLHPNAGTHEE